MYAKNIDNITLTNENYRKVIYTNPYQQLVLMALAPGEDIPMETHAGSQAIKIVSGRGTATVSNKRILLAEEKLLIVPPKAKHYIKNTGDVPLKLYSLYSPPVHKDGLINKRQPEDEHN